MAKNKNELIAEAQSLGVNVDDNPSKVVLQERIDAKLEDMARNVVGPDALLGAAPSRYVGGRGDQNVGG